MHKFFRGAMTTALVFSLTMWAISADAAQPMKIGVINLQHIMANSKFAKSIQSQLQAKGEELQKNVQKERDKYDALKSEIDKKKTVWSQEVLQEKIRDLQKTEEYGKIVSRDATYELQTLEKKLMGPVLNELGTLINDYGKREGFTMIMDNTGQGARSGILYVDATLDISEKILKELDVVLAKKKK
ncbi:MAG: OmpH family outer membrane protein [Desulfobulbaceae bacterium]|nr:OmpH family outer membrane protein [Desulfobulbaceae bacterium]